MKRFLNTIFSLFLICLFLILKVYAYYDYSGKMKDFMGANTSLGLYPNAASSIVDEVSPVFKWIREYHKWDHLEGCNNNEYLWDSVTPSCYGGVWPEHTAFMQECDTYGINVLLCVEKGTPWISGSDDIPYDNGDGSTEVNYRERAEYMAQVAARYGQTTHSNNNLESADNLSGLDLIRYYEDFNEEDWSGNFPGWKYAKYLNAVHDGYNCPDGGSHPIRGIKNGDPNAIHIMGGTVYAAIDYLNEIMLNTDGRIPFDILNFHMYCTEGWGTGGGYAPEHDTYGLKPPVDEIKAWRNANCPGMPIWCSEFGWDTYDTGGKHSYVFARGPDPFVCQANYLMRSFALLKGWGIDKVFMFMYGDNDSSGITQYDSCGVVYDDTSKKVSYYYLAAMQDVIGDLYFSKIDLYGIGSPEVYSYVFTNAPNTHHAYMLWCRQSGSSYDNGSVINNYTYNIPYVTSCTQIKPQDGSLTGIKTNLAVSNPGTSNASVIIPQISETPLFLEAVIMGGCPIVNITGFSPPEGVIGYIVAINGKGV